MVAHLVLTRQKVPSLRALIETSPHPVEKFSLVVDDKARRKLAMQALAERGDCTVTSSMPYNLELNTATANKGRALLQLGSLLGLQAAQVMAMGDSLNDLDMLNMAGYAVAMADARPEVLAAADAVTTTSDEDGVARAINAAVTARPSPRVVQSRSTASINRRATASPSALQPRGSAIARNTRGTNTTGASPIDRAKRATPRSCLSVEPAQPRTSACPRVTPSFARASRSRRHDGRARRGRP